MRENAKIVLFFGIAFVVLGIIIFAIFSPFIKTILLAFVFTFLLFPVFEFMQGRINDVRVSSFLSCLLFILLLSIPLIITLNIVTRDVFSVSEGPFEKGLAGAIASIECTSESEFCFFVNNVLQIDVLQSALSDTISASVAAVKTKSGELLLKVPNLLLHFFIMLFMMYYLFMDGVRFIEKLKSYIPLKKSYKRYLFRHTTVTLRGILYGNIIVGLVQSFCAWLGFFMFGVDGAVYLAILIFFASFLPMVGTGIIWAPVSLYYLSTSFMAGDSSGVLKYVFLLVYLLIFVGTIDNVIRPKLVADQIKIHPLLVLFGALGGIGIFGAAGLVLGPLVLGLFITLLKLFEQSNVFGTVKQ